MRIAITGGAGFIRSNPCALALPAGHEKALLDAASRRCHGKVVVGRRLLEGTTPGTDAVALFEAHIPTHQEKVKQ